MFLFFFSDFRRFFPISTSKTSHSGSRRVRSYIILDIRLYALEFLSFGLLLWVIFGRIPSRLRPLSTDKPFSLPVLWWFTFATTIQIITYSILAIELKRRAPRANTILEVVRIRFGGAAHLTMMFMALGVQIIVTCGLLLGAAAAINAITGASTIAMNFLIPLGVVVNIPTTL